MDCTDAYVLQKERTRESISKRNLIFKLATELREDYLAERRARRSAPEQESNRISRKSLQQNKGKWSFLYITGAMVVDLMQIWFGCNKFNLECFDVCCFCHLLLFFVCFCLILIFYSAVLDGNKIDLITIITTIILLMTNHMIPFQKNLSCTRTKTITKWSKIMSCLTVLKKNWGKNFMWYLS